VPIIYFFGVDGSGKTTLAKHLSLVLKSKGFKVKLSWMRGTHLFASILARLIANFTAFKGSDNPYYGIQIPGHLRRLWQLIEFASAIPIILFKFILPSAIGYWIVAERYLPDFITWVSLTTNDQHYPESVEAKFLFALSSKAESKIYVTTSLKEIISRRGETDLHFIKNQLKLYPKISSALHAHRLDTTKKSVDESLKEILTIMMLDRVFAE